MDLSFLNPAVGPTVEFGVISVIIPTLNEEQAMPRTLDCVLGQSGHCEVILVDGGSEDGTVAVARKRPGVQVVEAARGRSVQMNAGAARASGEILLFLHADTLLPRGAIQRLNSLEADTDCHAGGFHQRFSGSAWPLAVISWLHNTRCALTGIFYGDQTMFVRRALFEELGGFPEAPMLEDVMLSERLRRHGRPRFLREFVITDSRKFEQMGPWRSLLRCVLILGAYELRLPIPGRRFFSPVR